MNQAFVGIFDTIMSNTTGDDILDAQGDFIDYSGSERHILIDYSSFVLTRSRRVHLVFSRHDGEASYTRKLRRSSTRILGDMLHTTDVRYWK